MATAVDIGLALTEQSQGEPAPKEADGLPNVVHCGTIEELLHQMVPQQAHSRAPQCWEDAWQQVLQAVGTTSLPHLGEKLQTQAADGPVKNLEPAGASEELGKGVGAPVEAFPSMSLPLMNTWVLHLHREDDIEAYLEAFEWTAQEHCWPRKEWLARLKPYLNGKALLACSVLERESAHIYDVAKGSILHQYGITTETQRQCFRRFRYQETKGPREACRKLQALGQRWLQPEKHTKEQILELLILEQFLAILPQEMQSWVRECSPETCAQAVDLAEGFQLGNEPPVPFKDVCVKFSNEEWAFLTEEQRALYRDVTLENFQNVSTLGVPHEKPEIMAQIQQGVELCFQSDTMTETAPKSQFTGNFLFPNFKDQATEKRPLSKRASMAQHEQATVTEATGECSGPAGAFGGPSPEEQPLNQGNPKMAPARTRPKKRQASAPKGQPRQRKKRPATPGQAAPGKKCPRPSLPGETSGGGQGSGNPTSTAQPGKRKRKPEAQDRPPKLKKQPASVGKPPKLRNKAEAAGEPPKLEKEPPLPERKRSPRQQEKRPPPPPFLLLQATIHEAAALPVITWHPPFSATVVPDLTCAECGRAFKQRADLRRHHFVHTREKPYACTLCEKRFRHPSNLHIHLRTHSGERPYQCPDCGKAFSQSCNLRTHSQIHSGSKPYRCCVCAKAFRHSSNLTIHQRVHTGERPYPCSACPKRFSDRSTLVQHERTHTGERPYACHVCEQRFSQVSHLVKHSRVHPGARGPPKPTGALAGLSPAKSCFRQADGKGAFRVTAAKPDPSLAWISKTWVASSKAAAAPRDCAAT
ncbi:zinc finger protein 583-like [Elgaria multicarinata webbii]|uniref:zinc finger protein 583-like n=1 Tax=Elgaria multicarinata webbii TaxID=159646 RepID=UPI002FCD547C